MSQVTCLTSEHSSSWDVTSFSIFTITPAPSCISGSTNVGSGDGRGEEVICEDLGEAWGFGEA